MTHPQFNQTKRQYPRLPASTHPDVVTAFNDLHDHVYELRGQIQKMQSAKTETASKPAKNAPTMNLAGINVKAPTDSASLQNGYTIRYNSKSGQFEFGV